MTRKIFLAIAILIAGYVAFILGFHSLSVAYFEHKCDTQSGEFIYRVVKNVEGLYQMRLRDPKDYFDRLKRGDIPEDPFGHTNREAQNPETLFVNPPPRKYRYLETTRGPDVDDYERGFTSLGKRPAYTGEKYWIYYGYSQFDNTPMVAEQRSALKSRYGFTWREVRGFWDEVFRVYGGELLVMDMKTQEVLGLRRGFVQWEWEYSPIPRTTISALPDSEKAFCRASTRTGFTHAMMAYPCVPRMGSTVRSSA